MTNAMTTDESVFGINKPRALLSIGLLCAANFVVAFGFIVSGYDLLFSRTSIGNVIIGTFGVTVMLVILFGILSGFESLVRLLQSGGPALIVTDKGVCYRVASDDCVFWNEIREVVPYYRAGLIKMTKVGLTLKLSPAVSASLRWRSAILNSYKPETLTIAFRLIDAPKAQIEEAIRRKISITDYD